ncbi:MAG: FAD-binding protein [Candidatus Dormibacteraeota bacterium]|uniref:FAD-binding protein n=1 Tax=Candidatus Amunia macphersoniae TaxID=3127014 RepID=A0A934N9K3_9BACT|nr:FAD-binding protein [Candidatus Dormibacteraeota bacterium]
MDSGLVAALARAVPTGGLITAPEALRTYECDGLTGHRVVPSAVVLPESTDQVAACVSACHQARVPFVARGAGTGLSGGALPVADGVVICLTRMRAILDVDIQGQRVTVQPGVANLQVSDAVRANGHYYAPDPSSQSVCTIGGNVAENSGGAHCLKYGFTTTHVVGVTLVTPDGRVTTLGGAVADAPGYDLLGVVVGSEGTLGIVTEVILNIIPIPETVRTMLCGFASMSAAGLAVSAIIAEGITPAAIEMMDRLAIEAVEAAVHADYPRCQAVLLVELDGPRAECASTFARVEEICRQSEAQEIRVAADASQRAMMWRGRRAAFAAMGRISPDYYVQDGVIPRGRLAPVLDGIAALEQEYDLRVANVFHAGDGNLHPLVLYTGSHHGEGDRALELAGRILDLCLSEGGSITGEHGVGSDKACAMPKMFSEGALEVFTRVRAAFDPDGVCNPGKVLPTPRLCGEVPGPYRPHPLEIAGVATRM